MEVVMLEYNMSVLQILPSLMCSGIHKVHKIREHRTTMLRDTQLRTPHLLTCCTISHTHSSGKLATSFLTVLLYVI